MGLTTMGQDLRIFKKQIADANPPLPIGIIKTITALHGLSADIFNNISHVLELPWENYLNEMHEFGAEGDDELRMFKDTDVERKWASLVRIFQMPLHHLSTSS